MLKKAPAILLILIANILLLGHTVVPHHHHGEHICICNYSEHSHDNTATGGNHSSCSHEESQKGCNSCPLSGNGTEGKCNFLELMVLIPANETKSDNSSISGHSDSDGNSDYDFRAGSLPDFFIAYLSNHLYPDFPEQVRLLREHNDQTPLLCGIYFTKGLRAPPAV